MAWLGRRRAGAAVGGRGAPRRLPDGWVRPWPGPSDVEPAVLGTLGGELRPTLDPRGLLTPGGAGGSWSLDWWLGASDRWHVPAEEDGPTAVQQHAPDGLPVVETTVRIPGGTAVQRAWCTRLGDRDAVVVEVENRSREPIALALAVRPVGGSRAGGAGVVRRIVAGDHGAEVDGWTIVLDRPTAARAGSTAAAGDVAELVLDNRATGREPVDVRCGDGLATAALVVPVAHGTSVRAAVLPPGTGAPAVDAAAVRSLPAADAARAGWRAHLDAAAVVGLPDEGLAAAVRAARTALLLRPEAQAAGALGRWGHADAAAGALAALLAEGPLRTPEAITGAGRALLALEPDDRHEPAVLALAEGAHRTRAAGDSLAPARVVAAAALDHHRQPEAADAVRALLRTSSGGAPARTAGTSGTEAGTRVERLAALVAAASPSGTWVDTVGAAADLLAALADLLAADALAPAEVALATPFPPTWLGQPLEVHGLVTTAGRLAYAVRWHGARPALLWERAPSPVEVTLRAPVLDPGWSSAVAQGEALLAPVEPAGGLPGVVRPLTVDAPTKVDDADPGGVSFR